MKRIALIAVPLLALAGCGGKGAGGLTIHLTSAGVSSKSASIHGGGTVSFVNDDTIAHTIDSDPHPAHDGCTELNGTSIAPGATWKTTMASIIETCGYHDETNPANAAFQGTIQTVAGGGGGGGWIVGAQGLIAQLAGAAVDVVNPPTSQDLQSLFCVSPAGWAAGAHGALIYTADDGAHWLPETTGVDATLRAVAFANATLGLAAGDGGVLLRTTDAGAHWSAISATAATLRAADFSPDGLHAWIAGDAGTLLWSDDAGLTFHPATGVPAATVTGIRFATANPLTGFAVGAGGLVIVSHDGGQSWAAAASAPRDLDALQVSQDASRVIAVGAGGLAWISTDGGATFHEVATGVTAELRAVGFAEGGSEGWAAGAGGAMVRTLDQGRHFGAMDSTTTLDINSVENER